MSLIGKRVILCCRSDTDLQRFNGRTGIVVSFVEKCGRWRVHCDKISHPHAIEELKVQYLCATDRRGGVLELDVPAAHLGLLTPGLAAADSTDSADLAAAVAQLKLDEPNLTARDVHHRLATDATWSTTQLSDVKRVCSKLAKTGGTAAGLRLAPASARDESIRIAMVVAVVDGNSAVLKQLLSFGAAVYKNDGNANSVLAFFSAAGQYSQSAECLRLLLAHFPVGSHVFGRWPIAELIASTATVAGENGNGDQLHDLIEHGHDLGAWSGLMLEADAVSPLEATWGRAAGGAWAALKSDYRSEDISHATCDGNLSRFVDCLAVLFDAGLKPTASLLNERFLPNPPLQMNSKSPHGRTLLMTACGHDEDELVEQLLDFGADMELVCETPGAIELRYCGCTGLGIASRYGHVRCVKLLLKAGASVSFASSYQPPAPSFYMYRTPLDAACSFAYPQRKKIISLLVVANAPLDITVDGRTPLISVCCRDYAGVDNRMSAELFEDAAACASILLEAGASPDLRVTDGDLHATQTALMAAAQCGMAGCIRALVRHKASLDLVDSKGCTAFVQAVAMGGVEAAMLLSAAGADRLILPHYYLAAGLVPDDTESVLSYWPDLIVKHVGRVSMSQFEAQMRSEVMLCLVARGPEPLKSNSSGLLLSLSNVFLPTSADDALMALEQYDGGKCTMAASSDNVFMIIQGLEARGDTRVICMDDISSLLKLPTLPLRSVHQVFVLSFKETDDNDSSEAHIPVGMLFVPSSATKQDRTLQHEFDDVLAFFIHGDKPLSGSTVGTSVRFGGKAGDGVAAALALLGGGITVEMSMAQLKDEPRLASVPLQTMPSTSVERRCAYCAATQAADGTLIKLKSCARCRQVWYCSTECQQAHWKAAHKKTCTQV